MQTTTTIGPLFSDPLLPKRTWFFVDSRKFPSVYSEILPTLVVSSPDYDRLSSIRKQPNILINELCIPLWTVRETLCAARALALHEDSVFAAAEFHGGSARFVLRKDSDSTGKRVNEALEAVAALSTVQELFSPCGLAGKARELSNRLVHCSVLEPDYDTVDSDFVVKVASFLLQAGGPLAEPPPLTSYTLRFASPYVEGQLSKKFSDSLLTEAIKVLKGPKSAEVAAFQGHLFELFCHRNCQQGLNATMKRLGSDTAPVVLKTECAAPSAVMFRMAEDLQNCGFAVLLSPNHSELRRCGWIVHRFQVTNVRVSVHRW